MTLEQLIAIDSQNPGTDYAEITQALSNELKAYGAEVKKVGKNVVGIWGKPTLLINVHIDTVKAKGWLEDPLKAAVTEDKTMGLGACDNKGNIYCILKAIASLQDGNNTKKSKLNCMVLFSVDEEFGKRSGANDFVESEHASGIQNVIVLEPTENKVVTKHPSYYGFELTFTATQEHSSIAKENAIVTAAKAITKLDGHGFTIGSIESANIAGNVSAGECRIKASTRIFATHADAVKIIEDCAPGATIEFALVGLPFENRKPFIDADGDGSVGFWSEAAIFAQHGYNTILYGAGSIKQAHAPNEYIDHDSLKKCIAFLKSVLVRSALARTTGESL